MKGLKGAVMTQFQPNGAMQQDTSVLVELLYFNKNLKFSMISPVVNIFLQLI